MKKGQLTALLAASMLAGDSSYPKFSKRTDRRGLMFKKGLEPMYPSKRHPASALLGAGWRTESQLDKIAKRRARHSRDEGKYGFGVNVAAVANAPKTKQIRPKNPITKLFSFINGKYLRNNN